MTQRHLIKTELILNEGGLTCGELTQRIAIEFSKSSKYLNGAVSSLLSKMVKSGEIEICSLYKGPRGGKVYKAKI